MANEGVSKEARSAENDAAFFPKGAIAFFVCLLAGFAAIWLAMYVLLVHRQFHP